MCHSSPRSQCFSGLEENLYKSRNNNKALVTAPAMLMFRHGAAPWPYPLSAQRRGEPGCCCSLQSPGVLNTRIWNKKILMWWISSYLRNLFNCKLLARFWGIKANWLNYLDSHNLIRNRYNVSMKNVFRWPIPSVSPRLGLQQHSGTAMTATAGGTTANSTTAVRSHPLVRKLHCQ